MYLRSALIPLVLCGGCLLRNIDHHIDQVHCGGSSSGGGTTGACPETTGGVQTATSATTVGSTSETGGTDSESGGTQSGSSESSGTGGSSSTGEPVAVCGNGVVEAFGADPEECDDGNDDPSDGCSDCGRERRVFVTSQDYQGFTFMGLDGADQRCRSLADKQGLENYAGFKAWLSDSQVSAGERMFHGRGRYVLVNGLVVADSWDALIAGELKNPINVTETSETKEYGVWTGTLPDGSAAPGADHCADWSGFLDENAAFWGRSAMVSSQWTIAEPPVGQPGPCSSVLALYCFEQE